MCRFFVFLSKHKDYLDVQILSSSLPPHLSSALTTVGALEVLKNTRSHLNALNAKSEYVSSAAVSVLSVCSKGVSRGALSQRREVQRNTWLDMGLQCMTVDVRDKECMMKVPYELLRRIHFSDEPPAMQVDCISLIVFH